MAETKTKPTAVSVDAFLDAVEPKARRGDARTVCAMLERLSGEPPRMWGPTMVGFGRYHYKYDSGHEGDAMRIGFSPRKPAMVLYVLGSFPTCEPLLAKLGKHTTGKSCLYIKKLADVDLAVLEALCADSLTHMRKAYPAD